MSVNPIKHKLVERTYIDQHHQYYQIIDDLSWKAKNLFNVANYHIVNADWNGLCNIGRKVFGNEFVSNLIGALPLSPRLVNPI